MTNWNQLFIRI